jgi:hypothetical protein
LLSVSLVFWSFPEAYAVDTGINIRATQIKRVIALLSITDNILLPAPSPVCFIYLASSRTLLFYLAEKYTLLRLHYSIMAGAKLLNKSKK